MYSPITPSPARRRHAAKQHDHAARAIEHRRRLAQRPRSDVLNCVHKFPLNCHVSPEGTGSGLVETIPPSTPDFPAHPTSPRCSAPPVQTPQSAPTSVHPMSTYHPAVAVPSTPPNNTTRLPASRTPSTSPTAAGPVTFCSVHAVPSNSHVSPRPAAGGIPPNNTTRFAVAIVGHAMWQRAVGPGQEPASTPSRPIAMYLLDPPPLVGYRRTTHKPSHPPRRPSPHQRAPSAPYPTPAPTPCRPTPTYRPGKFPRPHRPPNITVTPRTESYAIAAPRRAPGPKSARSVHRKLAIGLSS